MATEHQDTVAVLQLLSAALGEYGQPEGLVSDNGPVFTSDAYEGLLDALGIEVCHIEKGKPWQDLAEAQFKVQLRLSEVAFQQAEGFAEVQERHAAFVETFNTTPHWAHREREDGLRAPVEVLRWARGAAVDAAVLHRALRHLQVERVVNTRGYVSVQRFYIYAERGLSRTRVSVWLYDGRLEVAHRDTLLAHYTYRYDRRARRLRAVEAPHLYHTPYTSPQLELWELDDEQWRKVTARPYERRPRPTSARVSSRCPSSGCSRPSSGRGSAEALRVASAPPSPVALSPIATAASAHGLDTQPGLLPLDLLAARVAVPGHRATFAPDHRVSLPTGGAFNTPLLDRHGTLSDVTLVSTSLWVLSFPTQRTRLPRGKRPSETVGSVRRRHPPRPSQIRPPRPSPAVARREVGGVGLLGWRDDGEVARPRPS